MQQRQREQRNMIVRGWPLPQIHVLPPRGGRVNGCIWRF
jgi:hypothetical protein